MEQINLREKILRIIANVIGQDLSQLQPEMHLEADLGIDSIGMATLVAQFEPFIFKSSNVNELLQSLLAAQTIEEILVLIECDANIEYSEPLI